MRRGIVTDEFSQEHNDNASRRCGARDREDRGGSRMSSIDRYLSEEFERDKADDYHSRYTGVLLGALIAYRRG